MPETLTPAQAAQKASSAYQRGEFEAAGQLFQSAQEGYRLLGDSLNAAEQANNASVAFLQAGNAGAAFEVVQHTPAVFQAAGDLRRQGMALGNMAAALEALHRLEEAAQIYEQAAEVLSVAGADDLRVHVLQSLSALQLRTGKQLQALATMQAGLEDIKKPTPKQRFLKRLLQVPFRLMNKS